MLPSISQGVKSRQVSAKLSMFQNVSFQICLVRIERKKGYGNILTLVDHHKRIHTFVMIAKFKLKYLKANLYSIG